MSNTTTDNPAPSPLNKPLTSPLANGNFVLLKPKCSEQIKVFDYSLSLSYTFSIGYTILFMTRKVIEQIRRKIGSGGEGNSPEATSEEEIAELGQAEIDVSESKEDALSLLCEELLTELRAHLTQHGESSETIQVPENIKAKAREILTLAGEGSTFLFFGYSLTPFEEKSLAYFFNQAGEELVANGYFKSVTARNYDEGKIALLILSN